ncbi:aminodeoxychorismate synthase component I [bacterium]|nr:aminodeoxychorismate synthase component I [bacterium]
MSPGSFAIFEDTKNKNCFYFQDPIEQILINDISKIKEGFHLIENWRQQGMYVVGHVSYEAGFAFYPRKDKGFSDLNTPLLHFLIFKEKHMGLPSFLQESSNAKDFFIFDYKADLTEDEYKSQQEIIQQSLMDGEYYQLNQTFQKSFRASVGSTELYQKLKQNQKTSYTAFIKYPAYEILSFSPELFYRKQGCAVVTEPMKGTLSSDLHPEKLLQDEKQIAENLMIVDLLRNDLGKIAHPGTVKVEELFKIQTFETVHQMTSKISAQIESSTPIVELFSSLFPCGSITGAPKWRAMQSIAKMEKSPRGVYTGAIGFVEPNNDQCFSVAIRTLTHRGERYSLGLGGGIVADSKADQEWREAKLKGQFVSKINEGFFLFETLLFDGKIFKSLSDHINRLNHSAQFFDFSIDTQAISQELVQIEKQLRTMPHKIKIKLFYKGNVQIESEPLRPTEARKEIILSSQKVLSTDIFQAHKTSRRDLYDSEWQRAANEGFYDIFFLNEQEQVVEASRHNIFIRKNNEWFTPPLSSGALPGIERQRAIMDLKAIEQELGLHDITSADDIVLTNSLRGRVPVRWSQR